MNFHEINNKKGFSGALLIIIIGILATIFVSFGMNFLFNKEAKHFNKEVKYSVKSPKSDQERQALISQKKVLYIIDNGEEKVSQYQIIPSENSTVFSLLNKLAETENFKIESTKYKEMGVFVESIAGLKGGTDNKWWQYFVNGKLGEVAADKKKVKEGDKIEWEFKIPPKF